MKKLFKLLLIMVIAVSMVTACSTVTETDSTPSPAASEKTDLSQTSETASTEPSSAPTPEPSVSKVVLSNNADSTGNSQYQAAHYGLHIAYTGEYIELMNYMTLLQHGGDITAEPVMVEGFEYQAEDLQFYDGKLYFLLYDCDNGVYYLY